MFQNPALEEFARLIDLLKKDRILSQYITRGEVHFEKLTLEHIASLLRDEAAKYFLLAAAGLNRTALKKEASTETARIVSPPLRKAYAVCQRLPVRRPFADVAKSAILLRRGDLDRLSKGAIEALFRERLKAEGIPVLMSPPIRHVPGLLIGRRKPDGVFPDPSTDLPPRLYLEIKNVRRVADDIQKRLYEVAEASIEMKILFGDLELKGFSVSSIRMVQEGASEFRKRLRERILRSTPTVVVLMLCSKVEAEKYREGAEAFVDRVFFQEEIDECLDFLRKVTVGES